MRKIVFILLFFLFATVAEGRDSVRVGSKKFTEGYLVSELLAQLIEEKGNLPVERRFGLGGTMICFEALRRGEIDLYPEYTGTAVEVILKGQGSSDWESLQKIFKSSFGLVWLKPFGFNNSYALALTEQLAEKKGIRTLSDLVGHPALRYGLSHEFLNRRDGWLGLVEAYHLSPQRVTGLEHGLAYEAVGTGETDIIDAYTTDAKIDLFHLKLLEDDRSFFPKYLAVTIVRDELLVRHPSLEPLLNQLAGRLTEEKMRRLNAAVELEKKSVVEVARQFLVEEKLLEGKASLTGPTLLDRVLTHLFLTFASTGLVALLAVPLGILISRRKRLAHLVISIAGIGQTIPSIALLVFMIPVFGIGILPALAALILYATLPILRNTCTGLQEISPVLLEAADGLGLTRFQRLLHVELPLARRFILAGIRISAVTNIGTATLAAFIGAGGLGVPIVTGLAMNDTKLVLSGAIPAALLAIITEILFEGIERWLTPRGLSFPP